MKSQKSIGILGGGNMATALLTECESDISVLNSTKESSQQAAEKIGAQSAKDIKDILKQDLLMLGVKPQILEEILQDTNVTQPIISLLAMTTCKKIRETLETDASITRIMPTMGSKIEKGLTAIYFEPDTPEEIQDAVREICAATGNIIELDTEKMMEAFTIHSSSMIAIMALLKDEIEKHTQDIDQQKELLTLINAFLIEKAENSGLKDAESITQQTWEGLYGMLEEDYSTEEIVKLVASKGGTTEAMLEHLRNEDDVIEVFSHYQDIPQIQKKFFSVLGEAIDIGLKKAGF